MRLLAKTTPSILALTRQGVPLLRTADTEENLSAKGAYVLIEPEGKRDVTLIGTGSELALAVEAAGKLPSRGSRPRSSRCPAGSCSRPSPRTIGTRS